MKTIIRIATVPIFFRVLLKGQLRYINQYYNVIGVSTYDKEIFDIIKEQEGVELCGVEMTRQITLFKDLKAVWKLVKLFRKEKPYIVHTHTPKAGTVGMIAAWICRVPHRLHTIAGLHTVEYRGSKRRLLNFVERVTYGCATKVYPNSRVMMQMVLDDRLCSADKLKVLANGSSNGIDTTNFNPNRYNTEESLELRRELGIKPDDFVFIFVGRLVVDKGIHELIEAFEKVSAKESKAKLLLVGDYESELYPLKESTINCINNNPNIIHVGWQSDVPPYFAISDALVFPSYREGFPNVVMQAGAMAIPSIVTNINGCNEIIIEGENGTIIETKDIEALEKKMNLFLNDREYVAQLSSSAREMITSRYEQEFVWEAILAEYRMWEERDNEKNKNN